jgi:hypothetical protein
MSKKSLLYIGAGVLLILSAIWSLASEAILMNPWIFEYEEFFRVLFKMKYLKHYTQSMGGLTWLAFLITLGTGGVLIAKGLIPDVVPSIALAGAFGLLSLFALIGFVRNFFEIFNNGRHFLVWVAVLASFLTLVAYGGMAAIIFMKDSFGGLYFVPAGALLCKAGMWFLIRVAGLFGIYPVGFGLCFFMLIGEIMLIAALFAAGMANNEE